MNSVKLLLRNCFSIALVLLLMTSCGIFRNGERNTSTVVGNKNFIQKLTVVQPFHSIQIDGYNVILVQDTLYQVRMYGEDNILEETHITNTNGVLRVNSTPRVNLRTTKKIEIYVHFIDINDVNSINAHYTSLGSITTDRLQITSASTDYKLELNVKNLRVDMAGNGYNRGILFATGTADTCDVFLTGKGAFDSPKLTGDSFVVNYSQTSFYRIKLDNFKEANVNTSSNRAQRIASVLLNMLAF